MQEHTAMSWKAFSVRLIEALRWPLAWVVIFLLLRAPIGEFIAALSRKLG